MAVKDGRAFRGHPKGLVLDGREHDGTLKGFGAEDDQSIDYLDLVNVKLPAPALRANRYKPKYKQLLSHNR